MNQGIKLVTLTLAFAVLLGGAYVLYDKLGQSVSPGQLDVQQTTPETGSESTESVNPTIPDFTVYDREGNPVKLSDFVGKPVVLNFWASWCPPCKAEMPDFEEKYKELGDEIHFLMVNMTDGSRETVEIAAKFIADMGYTFPVYYDTAANAANTYGVYSLPSTYFIDAQGHGVARATGALDAATLQQGIDMITDAPSG